MINTSLTFLNTVLNNFIALKDPFNSAGALTSPVILDNIVNQKSDLFHLGGDFVIMSLVNTEEETVGKVQLPYFKTADDKMSVVNPPIKLNLYIQFAAFSDTVVNNQSPYTRALKLLDQVVFFFQYRNVFAANQYPLLQQGGVEKLIIEPVSLTFEQLNHLWATLGAKYLPSVVYKCRTLTYRETVVSPAMPLITELIADETSI
ncbi:MAG TPA: DUF4255 domain-containing protein [Chitinophagaceae bacterium]